MIVAVVVAAGRGQRFGQQVPKQYQRLDHRTVLRASLEAMTAVPIKRLYVVLRDGDARWPGYTQIAGVPVHTVTGGEQRVDSVRNALIAMRSDVDDDAAVLVHDAARPLVTAQELAALVNAYDPDHGALLALPVTDTLKASAEGRVANTTDRSGLWRALTPQMFRVGALRKALASAGSNTTDEASAMEQSGYRPVLVHGSSQNIKITHEQDLLMARKLSAAGLPSRTGNGFDVHAFGPGDHVILGGVRIDHSQGLVAHSDGDVLLHAVCDGLLGAAALGDIGQHFPPSDEAWAGADSRHLLRCCHRLLNDNGHRVLHVDATLICERPKIGPHATEMRQNIADDLGLEMTQVSVKATTTERLGFTGRGEGIAAMASITVC